MAANDTGELADGVHGGRLADYFYILIPTPLYLDPVQHSECGSGSMYILRERLYVYVHTTALSSDACSR